VTTKAKKKTTRKTQANDAKKDANSETEASPPFEDALKELDVIVERMEDGEQSLEQSLADFEQGMKLAKLCESHLKTAEARVDKLMAASDDADTVDIESEA